MEDLVVVDMVDLGVEIQETIEVVEEEMTIKVVKIATVDVADGNEC
jgi:rRNA processing protein Krr1/Pno1